MKLMIADDQPDRLARWRSLLEHVPAVSHEFKIQELAPGELEGALTELAARRRSERKAQPRSEEPCAFDDIDLLIVDYDLTELKEHSSETGVGLAYLARCYSDCGYIVAINQFGNNPFDLTMLGDYEGFADLDLGGEQLSNPGLWSRDAEWPGFRPWQWPLIPAEVKRHSDLAARIAGRLDTPILAELGVASRLSTTLPTKAAAHLGAPDSTKATFETLLSNPSMGLRLNDVIAHDRRRARAAAARATQWLERWVLSAEDLLIDAPHLALRIPSQLSGDLNMTVRSAVDFESYGLVGTLIDEHRFDGDDWLSRPAWWWTSISGDERIPEVNDPWSAEERTEVFCEDSSRFIEPDQAVMFKIDPPTAIPHRYVERHPEVEYRPLANFVNL
jgi:hypothetical protein